MVVEELIKLLQKCDSKKKVLASPDAVKPESDLLTVEENDEAVFLIYEYIQD